MAVFTELRIDSMREELARLREARPFSLARFTAVLYADDEALTIRLDGESDSVGVGASAADFGLRGPASAWHSYLSDSPDVAHASLIGMTVAGEVSSGVLRSELAVEGEATRLFANLAVLNRLMEAARIGGAAR